MTSFFLDGQGSSCSTSARWFSLTITNLKTGKNNFGKNAFHVVFSKKGYMSLGQPLWNHIYLDAKCKDPHISIAILIMILDGL
jgi:hypothetical protein